MDEGFESLYGKNILQEVKVATLWIKKKWRIVEWRRTAFIYLEKKKKSYLISAPLGVGFGQ